MKIQLSDHFTYRRLLQFTVSPILMMVCTSLYSIIDGFFVSNFVGKTAFAAVNLYMPLMMGLGAFGFMVGAGGSAIISSAYGAGKQKLANRYFSMLIYLTIGFGVIVSIFGFIFMRPISVWLGATGALIDYCVVYGRILLISQTVFMLQNVFQNFLIAAEKPSLSLKISVAAGVTNAVLDFLFIVVFSWGIAGAAAATAIGQFVGGIIPLVYFARKNDSWLRLGATQFYPRILLKTCTNGSSELMTNISSSIVTILYNIQLMNLAGEDGVAAYGVIMYVNFIFIAIFIGYSIGSAPIISYHYGAANHSELKNLFRKSLILNTVAGVVLTAAAELSAVPLTKIFVSYDQTLFDLTLRGFYLYSLMFLVCGVNMWGSAFFTALNNGLVSALISFLRTLVFQVGAVLILPVFMGIDGIWLSVVAAEVLALFVTVLFFILKRKQYHYA